MTPWEFRGSDRHPKPKPTMGHFTCLHRHIDGLRCGRVHSSESLARKCCESSGYGEDRYFVKRDRAVIESNLTNWALEPVSSMEEHIEQIRWDLTNDLRGKPLVSLPVEVLEKHADEQHQRAVDGTSTARKRMLARGRERWLRAAIHHIKSRQGTQEEQAPPQTETQTDPQTDMQTNDSDLAVLRRLLGGGTNPEEVKAMAEQAARDAIAKACDDGSLTFEVKVQRPDGSSWTPPEGAVHAAFEQTAALVGLGLPVLLKGPAGTGKSFLAKQVAEALGLPFAEMSLSGGTAEHHFLGSRLPGKDGSFEHRTTPFLECYENGGVVLLDEVDACDENVLLAINNGIANGRLSVPGRDDAPFAVKHKDFRLIAAANTFGTGPSAMYVGRNQLDAAFLDRFATLEVDYDQRMERALCSDAPQLMQRWWEIREKADKAKLRRVVSTRSLLRSVAMHKSLGWSIDKCIEVFTTSWSDDECRTVGVTRG